jgi:hypothetical protein
MNYYKIQENGIATIKVADKPLEGYIQFEVGREPKELSQALLKELKLREDLKTSREYLNATDWYYIRKLERNVDVPADVVSKRADFIKLIQDNE